MYLDYDHKGSVGIYLDYAQKGTKL